MAKVYILGGIDVYRLLPDARTSFDAISLSVSFNCMLNSWSFCQLEQSISYKAEAPGKHFLLLDV
ncbi:MAG TPA: hypothetical protein PKL29_05385 [Methanothrix sp.]|nr:hypothetical protein [Methanothrix sp.]HPT37711.1 hypothetical protein [Methanothrix sp.]